MYEIRLQESGDNNGEIIIRTAENFCRHFFGSFDKMLHMAEELSRAYEAGLEDGKKKGESE